MAGCYGLGPQAVERRSIDHSSSRLATGKHLLVGELHGGLLLHPTQPHTKKAAKEPFVG